MYPSSVARKIAFTLALTGSLVLTACGGGGGGGNSTPTPSGSGIGPEGGVATSSDGKAKVTVPQGALTQTTDITVSTASSAPAGNIGPAYAFGPDGTTFQQPVTVAISYDDTGGPSGMNEADLRLGILVNAVWEEVAGSTVDTGPHTVTGATTHFSVYGVIVVTDRPTLPSAPTGVTATAGDGTVTITWDAVSGATSYNLYMATQSGVSRSNYSGLSGGMQHTAVTSPFVHTDLTSGTTYYFVITAVNTNGEGGESMQVSATPSHPITPGTEVTRLAKTGQTISYAEGDDGDLQKGVAWPTPRLVDNGDGTVTDNLTGLMWRKNTDPTKTYADKWGGKLIFDSGSPGLLTGAKQYIANINAQAGTVYTDWRKYNDWRLPTFFEMESIVDYGRYQPTLPQAYLFENVDNLHGEYFTSTMTDKSFGFTFLVGTGDLALRRFYGDTYTEPDHASVWMVRSTGVKGLIDLLHEVDQTQTVALNWPANPHFTQNGAGTVTDQRTGLMWTETPIPNTSQTTFLQALEYIKQMNQGVKPNFGYTDWRLPNRRELLSITALRTPGLGLEVYLVSKVLNRVMWVSTTRATPEDQVLGSWSFVIGDREVWPVRSTYAPPTP